MISPHGNTKGPKSPLAARGDTTGIAVGVDAIAKVAVETLKTAPAWLSGFVAIVAVLAILAVVLAGALVLKEQYILAVALAIVTLIGILVVALIIYRVILYVIPAAGVPVSKSGNLKVQWSRPMLQMPWNKDKLRDLSKLVEAIRGKAFLFLSEEGTINGLRAEEVRVNVFLPDYTNASDGEVCLLVMAPTLCAGMKGCPDDGLTLRVSQGITGKVYREQDKQVVARVLDAVEQKQDFNDIYELTAIQKKQIHPDLKWIVSSPLNIDHEGTNRTIGVLNVDGLKHEVKTSTLDTLAARIFVDVISLAKEFSKLSIVNVVTGVTEGKVG